MKNPVEAFQSILDSMNSDLFEDYSNESSEHPELLILAPYGTVAPSRFAFIRVIADETDDDLWKFSMGEVDTDAMLSAEYHSEEWYTLQKILEAHGYKSLAAFVRAFGDGSEPENDEDFPMSHPKFIVDLRQFTCMVARTVEPVQNCGGPINTILMKDVLESFISKERGPNYDGIDDELVEILNGFLY